jgi:DNA-binding HxlR family transcriptional regulator
MGGRHSVFSLPSVSIWFQDKTNHEWSWIATKLAHKTDLSRLNCSLAGALSIVGDWWSLLIVRDALLGARRFAEFQRSLGLARNILADRLRRLTADGVLAREGPERRPVYQLTEKGLALAPALIALMQWGDRWVSDERPPVVVTDAEGGEIDAVSVSSEGRTLTPRELRFRPGSGAETGTQTFLAAMKPRVEER